MKPDYYGLGGWSAPVAAAGAAWIAFRDSGQHRGSTIFDANVGGMGTEPLTFAAGDLLILFARVHQTGTTGTAADSASGVATGWNKFGFQKLGPGEDTWCIAAAWKVADGTETTVDLVDVAGAAGTVVSNTNYLCAAYTITGTPSLVMHTAKVTSGADMGTQTITSSAGDVPILAFSWAAGNTQPDPTFDTETPDENIFYGSSTSGGAFVRLKTKIFTSAPADITTTFGDLGTGNGLISGYFEVS